MIDSLTKLDQVPQVLRSEKQEAQTGQMYEIRYQSDAYEVIGYVAAPEDYLTKEYPVLIYNRGGNRTLAPVRKETIAQYVRMGFVVLASQYRGNFGGTGIEDFGNEDIEDVHQLILIAKTFGFARQDGYYIVGRSRGGMVTYRVCALYPAYFKAAVVLAGVADCFMMYLDREQAMRDVFHELVGGSPMDCPAEYAIRSAVCFASKIRVPVKIIHGTADWRVNLSQSVRLHELLDKFGNENQLVIFPGADHSLRGYPVAEEMCGWFRDHGYEEIKVPEGNC